MSNYKVKLLTTFLYLSVSFNIFAKIDNIDDYESWESIDDIHDNWVLINLDNNESKGITSINLSNQEFIKFDNRIIDTNINICSHLSDLSNPTSDRIVEDRNKEEIIPQLIDTNLMTYYIKIVMNHLKSSEKKDINALINYRLKPLSKEALIDYLKSVYCTVSVNPQVTDFDLAFFQCTKKDIIDKIYQVNVFIDQELNEKIERTNKCRPTETTFKKLQRNIYNISKNFINPVKSFFGGFF